MTEAELIGQMSPEFLKANQETIDEILFEKLQRKPVEYEAPDYTIAIMWAAFWIGLGLAFIGIGLGGGWK